MQTQPATTTTLQPLAVIQEQLQQFESTMHQSGINYETAVKLAKRQMIVASLERNKWNACRAAAELHMHRNSLSRNMHELNVSRPPRKYDQRRKKHS